MSPTRRDILKASAGAVGLALAARGASPQAVTASAAPETVRIECIYLSNVSVTLSDGRTAHLNVFEKDGGHVGWLSVNELELHGHKEEFVASPDLLKSLARMSQMHMSGALEDAGYEVQR